MENATAVRVIAPACRFPSFQHIFFYLRSSLLPSNCPRDESRDVSYANTTRNVATTLSSLLLDAGYWWIWRRKKNKWSFKTVIHFLKMCYTLSLPCPCLAMASYLIFPSASTCTARALEVFFFLPISRGNWATWISGKAPPSPKSYTNKTFTAGLRQTADLVLKVWGSHGPPPPNHHRTNQQSELFNG